MKINELQAKGLVKLSPNDAYFVKGGSTDATEDDKRRQRPGTGPGQDNGIR